MAEARGQRIGNFKLTTQGYAECRRGDNVTLPCHLSPETSAVSMTIRWFKGTECIYLYKKGLVIEGRGYEGRLTLDTRELNKGNVSLILKDFNIDNIDNIETDGGVYICQVKHGEQEVETAVALSYVDDFKGDAARYLRDDTAENMNRRLESAHQLETQLGMTQGQEQLFLEMTQGHRQLFLEMSQDHRQVFMKMTQDHRQQFMKMTQEPRLFLDMKMREKELKGVITENTQLAQQICNLKTELEKLRTASAQTESGYTSTAGPTLPVRRRWSINIPSIMGAETTDEDSTLPVRKRRRSKERRPDMAAESSLDPPVSPTASELRLVLLGRTAAGRSAAGNIILGREVFGAEASSSELSQRSRRREGEVCGRRLVLVDAPDFTGCSLVETREDVGLCVRLSAPGPHAFLLLLPVESSEGEARGMMEKIRDMFGESCWGHSIVIFTHNDSMKEQSVEEFLQAASQEHQQLVEKCGNRFHILNMKDISHTDQVSQLLEKIVSMVAGNTESFYSTETYQEVEAQVIAIERKIQRDREERRHMEEQEMRERFEKELKEYLREKEETFQELNGNFIEIEYHLSELEKQMREERDEEKKRELEQELRRESERREKMERKLERFKEERENEKREMEERHGQEIEEMREVYEGDARVEADTHMKKIILPEIFSNIMTSKTKMQREFERQLEEKDRQMKELEERLKLCSVLKEENLNLLEKTENIPVERTCEIEEGRGESWWRYVE